MIEIILLIQEIGAPGFLQDAGYTTRKDGLGAAVIQRILTEVFLRKQDMPEWLNDTITLQGGASQTVERFNKIRSTINDGLGAQKGLTKPFSTSVSKVGN